MKVDLSCMLCPESVEVELLAPESWTAAYGSVDVEDALCPDHAIVERFRESQCPGCVCSFGTDCALFDAFGYSGRRAWGTNDDRLLRRGICPKRVNGTLMVSGGSIRPIDLSSPAESGAGTVMADAIAAYIERYPS